MLAVRDIVISADDQDLMDNYFGPQDIRFFFMFGYLKVKGTRIGS